MLASNVNRVRNLGAEATDITQQAAAALLKGGKFQAPQVSVSVSNSSCVASYILLLSLTSCDWLQTKTIANQMAEKLNAKLGYIAKQEEEEDVVETVTRYEEELEINDFPQTCRWRVTSRVSLYLLYVHR